MNRDFFDGQVARWLSGKPSRVARLKNRLLATWFRASIPKPTPAGIWHWLIRIAIVASPPALLFLVYDRATAAQAFWALVYLVVLQVAADVIGGWRDSKKKRQNLITEELWVRIGDLIASIDSTATPVHFKDESVTACLGIIEGYARQVTRSKHGDVSVSLVLYDDGDRAQMTIKHRNPGNTRPKPRLITQLDRIFGHLACEAGPAPQRINDIYFFGRNQVISPTQSTISYRSIFIVPIQDDNGEDGPIRGFLSIDSRQPYAFYGDRGDKILITCLPLIDHIRQQI